MTSSNSEVLNSMLSLILHRTRGCLSLFESMEQSVNRATCAPLDELKWAPTAGAVTAVIH